MKLEKLFEKAGMVISQQTGLSCFILEQLIILGYRYIAFWMASNVEIFQVNKNISFVYNIMLFIVEKSPVICIIIIIKKRGWL